MQWWQVTYFKESLYKRSQIRKRLKCKLIELWEGPSYRSNWKILYKHECFIFNIIQNNLQTSCMAHLMPSSLYIRQKKQNKTIKC